MADLEAAEPAAPPQAPLLRRAVAAGAAALCGLGLAAYPVIYVLLGALWVSSAANDAHIAALWVYGAKSRGAAVTGELLVVAARAAGLLFAVLCFVAVAQVLLLLVLDQLVPHRDGANRKGEAQEIGGDGVTKMPAAQGVCGPVTKPIVIVLFALMAGGLLMVVLAPAKGSCEERIGYILFLVGSFLISLMFCLVLFPSYAIQVTAVWADGSTALKWHLCSWIVQVVHPTHLCNFTSILFMWTCLLLIEVLGNSFLAIEVNELGSCCDVQSI